MPVATATKVTFHRATLTNALAQLKPLAGRVKTLEVLKCVRIVADGERAVIEATDLDTRATLYIACEGEGETILPASFLYDLVSLLDSDSVALEIDGEKVTVRGGRSVTRVSGMAADEWPPAQAVEGGATYVLPSAELRRLAKVGFCVSDEVSRPILHGIWFHEREGKLSAVATNGHRLALQESDLPGGLDAIVPGVGLGIVLKLLGGAEEVSVRLAGNHIEFTTDTAAASLRTIEGPFPNYTQILPKDQDKMAVANRSVLLDALRRMGVVARIGTDDKQPPRITCEFSAEGVKLSAVRDKQNSAIEELVPLESYTGDPLRIGFNVGYLIELLGQLSSPSVEIRLKAPERSVTLRGADTDGLFLLMPLRLE